MSEEKRIIEINGIKMEVDLRNAKRIDTFKVGDPVKVLDLNYSQGCIKAGVIVGFAEFQKKPSIEIMVLDDGYNGVDFKFITVSNETDSKYEVVHYNNYEKIFTQSNVIDKFNREIEKKKIEITELERKKKYYVDDFSKAFSEIIG
jgi:alpha-galactosidase